MKLIWSRHPLALVDYDNWEYILGVIPGVITDLTKSSTPKSPQSTAPVAPSQATANQTAASTVADQRATLLASGGVTDNTGGLGILTGSDIKSSSLIGG